MSQKTKKLKKPVSRFYVIGLTGNIACGKSSVANILKGLKVAVLDADQIARDITKPGKPAGKKIKKEFGTLNRTELRKIVFSNPAKRKKLESILHPLIRKEAKNKIQALQKKGKKLIVYEASLIIETGITKDFDGILLVNSSKQTQLKRLLKRDSQISKNLALKMISAQMPLSQKKKYATWVIENNGSAESLKKKVQSWLGNLEPISA